MLKGVDFLSVLRATRMGGDIHLQWYRKKSCVFEVIEEEKDKEKIKGEKCCVIVNNDWFLN